VSTLGALYFKAAGGANSLEYGPTDTRIITVSSTLCDKMHLNVGESAPGYKVYLYALSQLPTVTKHSIFHLNENPMFQYAGDYQYYSYYMLKGSTFNVSACVLNQEQPRFNFYVIKGHENFVNFMNGEVHAEYQVTVDLLCQTNSNSYSYLVFTDEFYYLVFDAEGPTFDLALSIDFDLVHYKVYSNTFIDECHVNTSYKIYGSCCVKIPFSGDVINLLQVMPAENTETEWSFSTVANVQCSARIWMYILIASCMLIGIIGPFAFLYIFKRRMKSGSVNLITERIIAPLLPPSNSMDYGTPNHIQ
jgi:hypothetical protein